MTTFGGVEGSTTTTQVRSYSQRYQGVASAQAAQAAALAVLQQARAAAAAAAAGGPASAGHNLDLSARHGSSCAGSTASLSVGLEVVGAQGAAGYSSAGRQVLQEDDSLRLSGQADSSGRGSCSSAGLCGEFGGTCGSMGPLGVHAAAHILDVSGSTCPTAALLVRRHAWAKHLQQKKHATGSAVRQVRKQEQKHGAAATAQSSPFAAAAAAARQLAETQKLLLCRQRRGVCSRLLQQQCRC